MKMVTKMNVSFCEDEEVLTNCIKPEPYGFFKGDPHSHF
ncbi:hypothetical protein LEP1GSC165_1220 [Leptospira santarosai str. CBC523]|nr:hypothetical protein LEP1GSC165_1220 [Leptospira santarosai str. CBC523]